ncbi:MAG: tetratricopeptide repeat protein [Planctomycetota bacterium]
MNTRMLLLCLIAVACSEEKTFDPVDPAALAQKHEQAEKWMSRGVFQKALPIWEEIVEADPSDWVARFELGRTFMAYGDRFDEAAEQFEAAAELAPQEAKIHRQLGIARRYLGQFEAAARALEASLKIEPGHARTLALQGLTLLETDALEAARSALEESLRVESDNVEALFGLGELQRRSDDLEGACELYRQTLRVDPFHLAARHQLGLCQRDLGEREEAKRHLELHRLINSLSDNVVDRTRPELDRFQGTLEQILELEPENWRALEDLGAALEAREEVDAAKDAYRKALEINPDAQRAQQALERMQ